MAHYLAEVIVLAEAAEGTEKRAAERECFEVILQLWKHRASLPSSRRPMESFEPIFDTLGRLLDRDSLAYFHRPEDPADPESELWIELATRIDYAARELIRWCMALATSQAVEKDGAWLESKTARALDDGADLKAARLLAEDAKILIGIEEKLAERRAKELTEMRNRLDGLVTMSKTLRDQIDAMLMETPRED